jgi:hypothetical protein
MLPQWMTLMSICKRNNLQTSFMKKIFVILILSGITCIPALVNAQQVIVSDDAAYTTPATGAMLDVKSTTKGFIVPRMTTAQRTTLGNTNPANGVVVYDTDLKSFWYWESGAWLQIAASGINLSGIKFGDASNYSTFEADGTLLMVGNATVYDDLRVPLSEPSTGTTKPDWARFPFGATGDVPFINWFKASGVDEMYFVVQMPHDWAEGTTIHPHIHWVPSANGSGSVFWKLQYTFSKLGEEFPAYDTKEGTTTVPNETLVKDRHYLTPLGEISGTGKTISSMLICRIYRDGSHASDTYLGLAGALEIDFHYIRNTLGSRTEYTK